MRREMGRNPQPSIEAYMNQIYSMQHQARMGARTKRSVLGDWLASLGLVKKARGHTDRSGSPTATAMMNLQRQQSNNNKDEPVKDRPCEQPS